MFVMARFTEGLLFSSLFFALAVIGSHTKRHFNEVSFEKYIDNGAILLWGDSLTKGLYRMDSMSPNIGYHPYSLQISALLQSKSSVIEQGVNGEQTSSMLKRLSEFFSNRLPSIKAVVILGGTNDILNMETMEEGNRTLSNVIQMHTFVHSRENVNNPMYTVAVTIPSLGLDISDTMDRERELTRLFVNNGLRQYAAGCSSLVLLLDFENLFDQRIENNHKYWSTEGEHKVHFSPAGYDRIGTILYNSLVKFIALKEFSQQRTIPPMICTE
jgi:lysophospholipase L1-like esterase